MKVTPTNQQLAVVAEAKTGANIAVKALAGASKTTTAVLVAKAVPKVTLYVAYNKAIATEAQGKFQQYAECRTMHSLAYQAVVVGSGYKNKLQGFFDRKFVASLVDEDEVGEIESLIEGFCTSADISIRQYCKSLGLDRKRGDLINSIWNSIIDDNSSTGITHNVYLKLFQLSKPKLPYDLIIVDEFQDINPVSLAIILDQEAQKIVIGDPWQSIYAFNGAINAFNSIPDNFTQLELTTSFRFPQKIANLALQILEVGGYEGELNGGGKQEAGNDSIAILARTNLDLFLKAKELMDEGRSFKVIGGFKELYSMLWSAMALRRGDRGKIYHKRIKAFDTFAELREACETQTDLGKIVSIMNAVEGLPQVLMDLKKAEVVKGDADITLSSIHKAKGLEWGTVVIQEGLIPTSEEFEDLDREGQIEWMKDTQLLNLAYIAVTRAEGSVNLPYDLINFFNMKNWR